ncbi:hypothetical protein CANCADRAFT_30459 [Tortispora caseinolytica NRRL Y-17796]|uniref:Uncharacterized protein n=1 Tax=Tortispora caseinolytica NRRL Y-17796 TaxID=767744 RepID=A0A1E4TKE6_9ASCO|nr:hypothetical protein CANCADRAFT_30459 [Tortispora caseinolytica NRRL Y-17796]
MPAPAIVLTPAEKSLFAQLFRAADTDGVGVVTGDSARSLFEKSGLSPLQLGEIWQLSDTDNAGFLTQLGFSIACRLIGHVQHGRPIRSELISSPGPLPRFDGITASPTTALATSNAPATSSYSNPLLDPATNARSAIPPLTPADRSRFASLFDRTAPNGILSGDKAREIFLKARLSPEVLGQIWNLADLKQRGFLEKPQFIVAMHLIQNCLKGSLKSVPSAIPQSIYDAAEGTVNPEPVVDLFNASPKTSHAKPPAPNRRNSMVSPVALESVQSPDRNNFTMPLSSEPTFEEPLPVPLSARDRSRYRSLFQSLDTNHAGQIGSSEAVPFLKKSNLSDAILAQIWDLSDRHNTGTFDQDDFCIAMYFVEQALHGKPLPSSLADVSPTIAHDNPSYQSSNLPVAPMNPPVARKKTALDELFDLNDAFSSSPSLQNDFTGSSVNSQPPTGRASSNVVSPRGTVFVPQSSFGQQMAANIKKAPMESFESVTALGESTKASNPVISPVDAPEAASSSTFVSAPAPAPAPAPEKDLLDSADDVAVPQEAAALANLGNQVSSLTSQTQGLVSKRASLEESASLASKAKSEIETKLSQLRQLYDAEVMKVQQAETRLEQSRKETLDLRRDFSVLEATYHALQARYQETSSALELDQNENLALKEKIKVTNEEIIRLNVELEKLEKEARHVKGLIAINKKQFATVEGTMASSQAEAATLRHEIQDAQKELSSFKNKKEIYATDTGTSFANSHPSSSQDNILYPVNDTIQSEGPKLHAERETEDAGETLTHSVNASNIAAPTSSSSSSGPSLDTNISSLSPPDANTGFSSSMMPLVTGATNANSVLFARSGSVSSSVQNNAPLSVRGDIDTSRPITPESSVTNTAPVASLADASETNEAPSDVFSTQAAASGSEQQSRAASSQDSRASYESFEPVNLPGTFPGSESDYRKAENGMVHASVEDVFNGSVVDTYGSTEKPGSAATLEAPEIEASSFPPVSEGRSINEEFPPIRELEINESDSESEDETDDLYSDSANAPVLEPVANTVKEGVAEGDMISDSKKNTSELPHVVLDSSASVTPAEPNSEVIHSPVPVHATQSISVINDLDLNGTDTANNVVDTPRSATDTPDFDDEFSGLQDATEEAEEANQSADVSYDMQNEESVFGDFNAFAKQNLAGVDVEKIQESTDGRDEWDEIFADFSKPGAEAVIEEVTPTGVTPQRSGPLGELLSMGFKEEAAKAALDAHGGDLAQATNYLLDS